MLRAIRPWFSCKPLDLFAQLQIQLINLDRTGYLEVLGIITGPDDTPFEGERLSTLFLNGTI